MKRSILLGAAGLSLLCASGAFAQTGYATTTTTTTTTVTNATGTISALNYGNGGEVTGLLIGTNILLSFPNNICGGVGTLGAVGNSVTYSGTAATATSGFESVQVSSFTNGATKATYTAPTSATSSTAYGPTSGTIKQLNYSPDGTVDGFLFTASSSSSAPIFVSFGHTTASLTAVTTGATVSVTGTTSPGMAACSTTATLESVDASSLTIGTTTIVFNNGGFGGGPGGGRGGPGGH